KLLAEFQFNSLRINTSDVFGAPKFVFGGFNPVNGIVCIPQETTGFQLQTIPVVTVTYFCRKSVLGLQKRVPRLGFTQIIKVGEGRNSANFCCVSINFMMWAQVITNIHSGIKEITFAVVRGP